MIQFQIFIFFEPYPALPFALQSSSEGGDLAASPIVFQGRFLPMLSFPC